MVHHSLTRGHNGALVDWDGRQANKKPKTHIEKNRLFFFFLVLSPAFHAMGFVSTLSALLTASVCRMSHLSCTVHEQRWWTMPCHAQTLTTS